MPFQPTPAQAKAQAHAALRIGLGVGIRDDDGLWVAFAAETLNHDQLSQALALGGAEMIITHRRAKTLNTAAYFGETTIAMLPLIIACECTSDSSNGNM